MSEELKTLLDDAIGELPWYARPLARWVARQGTSSSVQRVLNIRFATRLRGRSVRVAFAVGLKLQNEDKYILVRVPRSRHPDSYGPFGGVVHHSNPDILNQLAWAPDPEATTFHDGPRYDVEDLRGVVDGKYVPGLHRWYVTTSLEREEPVSTLKRELGEELRITGLDGLSDRIGGLVFREVRSVPELIRVSGLSYDYQYRHFTILEGRPDLESTKRFAQEVGNQVVGNEFLVLATPEEIMRGRTRDGDRIASHSAYLFGLRRGRSDY